MVSICSNNTGVVIRRLISGEWNTLTDTIHRVTCNIVRFSAMCFQFNYLFKPAFPLFPVQIYWVSLFVHIYTPTFLKLGLPNDPRSKTLFSGYL